MFGKPRSSIPVAGKTSIPVKRTAQATSTTGRSTAASASSSIPVASRVSGKRFEPLGFYYGNVSRVSCLKDYRSSVHGHTKRSSNDWTLDNRRTEVSKQTRCSWKQMVMGTVERITVLKLFAFSRFLNLSHSGTRQNGFKTSQNDVF